MVLQRGAGGAPLLRTGWAESSMQPSPAHSQASPLTHALLLALTCSVAGPPAAGTWNRMRASTATTHWQQALRPRSAWSCPRCAWIARPSTVRAGLCNVELCWGGSSLGGAPSPALVLGVPSAPAGGAPICSVRFSMSASALAPNPLLACSNSALPLPAIPGALARGDASIFMRFPPPSYREKVGARAGGGGITQRAGRPARFRGTLLCLL